MNGTTLVSKNGKKMTKRKNIININKYLGTNFLVKINNKNKQDFVFTFIIIICSILYSMYYFYNIFNVYFGR